ncbi:AraC family transcriptional regulator [Mesorhizobium sp. M1409]|uniref:helix-turn-helix domain-containing protein n=1 Tax=unclassified Mesorhizobium TaxID=325217 RepID=UPI00333795D9
MGEPVSFSSNLIQISFRYDPNITLPEFAGAVVAPRDAKAAQEAAGPRRKLAGLSDWQKNKIVRYVDDNIDGTIRVESLGQQVRLSASRFSKGFKESFGRSPYDYVLLRRVEAAKYLIATTEEPLSQIAQACGLSDQAHLSKIFKRFVGMTPLRWRRAESGARPAPADAHRWRRLSCSTAELA